MLEQTFRIGLDPLFPPQVHYTNNTKHLAPDCSLEKLQLELIFDSARDGRELAEVYNRHSEEYAQMMGILQGSEKELDEVF
jgi:phytoene dehydrogenase-like protein